MSRAAEIVVLDKDDGVWVHLGKMTIEDGMLFLERSFTAMDVNGIYAAPGSDWEPAHSVLAWPLARVIEMRLGSECEDEYEALRSRDPSPWPEATLPVHPWD